jgi:sec-independent protein translocase protein TatB
MWNIGFGELAIICIVLIIAVGPERLPSMMKTVGKTVRTLRQASRDLRESTGIDELLREDFDYHPPPRRPAAPVVPPVAREADPVPVNDPTSSPMAPLSGDKAAAALAASEAMAASTSLPSDGPLTAAAPDASAPVAPVTPLGPAMPVPEPAGHADVSGTLPSDAPLAANEPDVPSPHEPAPPLTDPAESAKVRES